MFVYIVILQMATHECNPSVKRGKKYLHSITLDRCPNAVWNVDKSG